MYRIYEMNRIYWNMKAIKIGSHLSLPEKNNVLRNMMINKRIQLYPMFNKQKTRVGFRKYTLNIADGHHIARLSLFWAISDANLIVHSG